MPLPNCKERTATPKRHKKQPIKTFRSGRIFSIIQLINGTSITELAERKAWGELDELVVAREQQVKGDRAKLRKPHEYRYDQQRPIHDYPLDFRFGRANVIVQDILNGLGG